jgi:hypothetical protein
MSRTFKEGQVFETNHTRQMSPVSPRSQYEYALDHNISMQKDSSNRFKLPKKGTEESKMSHPEYSVKSRLSPNIAHNFQVIDDSQFKTTLANNTNQVNSPRGNSPLARVLSRISNPKPSPGNSPRNLLVQGDVMKITPIISRNSKPSVENSNENIVEARATYEDNKLEE